MNANKANELALKAKGNAEQGNQHMNKMLKSMEEINDSSSKISKTLVFCLGGTIKFIFFNFVASFLIHGMKTLSLD